MQDLIQINMSAARLKQICSALSECAAFDSDGWLKSDVHIKSSSSKNAKLYVKHFVAPTLPETEVPRERVCVREEGREE